MRREIKNRWGACLLARSRNAKLSSHTEHCYGCVVFGKKAGIVCVFLTDPGHKILQGSTLVIVPAAAHHAILVDPVGGGRAPAADGANLEDIDSLGTVQVGTAQVGTAQVGTAQVGTVQVGTVQVGTAPLAPFRLAPFRSAPLRLAPLRLAPFRLAPLRSARHRSARIR